MTYPVKYMIVEGKLWPYNNIVDTLKEGNQIVAKVVDRFEAHLVCKYLNELEGYKYEP